MKAKQDYITTCQICSRQILSKNGVIAHHGYTRPGDGWQTASCYGARRLPYEVSKDAIAPCIAGLKAQSEHLTKTIATWHKTRPDIMYKKYVRQNGKLIPEDVVKRNGEVGYGNLFDQHIRDMENKIKAIKDEIDRLTERENAWTPNMPRVPLTPEIADPSVCPASGKPWPKGTELRHYRYSECPECGERIVRKTNSWRHGTQIAYVIRKHKRLVKGE